MQSGLSALWGSYLALWAYNKFGRSSPMKAEDDGMKMDMSGMKDMSDMKGMDMSGMKDNMEMDRPCREKCRCKECNVLIGNR